jgi:hypothetical protein
MDEIWNALVVKEDVVVLNVFVLQMRQEGWGNWSLKTDGASKTQYFERCENNKTDDDRLFLNTDKGRRINPGSKNFLAWRNLTL